jgi:hypothetical protein
MGTEDPPSEHYTEAGTEIVEVTFPTDTLRAGNPV